MPRARFTIRGLVAAIVACGLLFTSLREASVLWQGIMATLCLGIFGYALIASICGPRDARVYWSGFAIGGLLHLLLSCGPFLENSLSPRLFTTAILDLSYDRVAKPEPPPPMPAGGVIHTRGWLIEGSDAKETAIRAWYEMQGLDYDFYGWANQSGLHSTATYRQIGHLWLSLLLGLATGRLAVRFRGANPSEISEAA